MFARLSLILAGVMFVSGFGRSTFAAEPETPTKGYDVLDRFVGDWRISGTAKPSKWSPEGGEINAQESAVWALKKRLVLIRAIDDADQKKSLWIATYGAKQNDYPFWGFDSKGLSGAKWRLTWDGSINKLSGRATDLPAGWTSGGQNHFTDGDTNVLNHWIKDENGELLLHHEGKKERQPANGEAAVAAAWLKHAPADDLPAELNVLQRMIGEWDTVSTMQPAEWTPEGSRSTAKIQREWILDGRFVMDTSMHSGGEESIALIGYEPNQNMYRSWWFNSEGQFPRGPSKGSWNEKAQTLSYVTELEDGKTMHSSVRFANQTQEVWDFKVVDSDGKVYFDMDILATRRAARGDK